MQQRLQMHSLCVLSSAGLTTAEQYLWWQMFSGFQNDTRFR
jgi:hypothetical protein